ncbi:hypothetical protein GCM10027347_25120 [Larkinella harenae]
MRFLVLLILAGLTGVMSCRKQPQEPTGPVTTVYRIKAGSHYSDNSSFAYISKTTLSFSVLFDNSAIYKSKLAENQYDINKLYGFSDCDSQHNTSSARFGWNWRDDSLRIHAYCYRNGIRIAEELGTLELNRPENLQLSIVGSNYVFTFKGKETIIARGCTAVQSSTRYRLYPYFGGDEAAPHTITISITENN